MIDQIFDRNYQGARYAMNSDATAMFERFFRAAANAFKVLNRIEYQAPWATPTKRARCN